MRRFIVFDYDGEPACMVDPDGDYVLYDDAQAEISRLKAEVESARESFAMLYEMLRDNPTYDIAAGVAKSGLDRTKEVLK